MSLEDEKYCDIRRYLSTLDKEILDVNGAKNVTQVLIDENDQYIYHSMEGQEMIIVENMDENGKALTPIQVKNVGSSKYPTEVSFEKEDVELCDPHIALREQGSFQIIPHLNQMGEKSGNFDSSNNQIVTILPSDSAGEVSYVFIVEKDPASRKNDTVYDFTEVDDAFTHLNKGLLDEDKKTPRTTFKKPQNISPVHMCNYCNYTSPKRYLLSRHMRSHSEERPHRCSVCERGFKTLLSLQNHVNTHTGIKPYHCKLCESSFTTSGELVRHVRYMHTHEKPHKCPDCDYASVELSKLKRHMRCHTGERPYQCSHCTYASPDSFKLKRHLRIHTGEKPYKCDVCNARFTQSNSLKAHRLIHSGTKPVYACEICPTTCGRKTDLRIHIQKLHTSDKPLKCKKCGKSFPDRYTMKQHNKTHEGEKCFKCDLCPYASSSARHLDSHMTVHTERKPFFCPECHQTFRQRQLLKRHQNLCHKPCYLRPPPTEKNQECAQCGKTFRHRGNLIRHTSSHCGEEDDHLCMSLEKPKKLTNFKGEQIEIPSGIEDERMFPVERENHQIVVLEVLHLQTPEEEESDMTKNSLKGDETVT